MTIQIMSRQRIEQLAKQPFAEPTAVISITEYNYSFATLEHPPAFRLMLAFDDVDSDAMTESFDGQQPTEDARREIEERYHMLSDEQARQIADFYETVNQQVTCLICQCEHGQSRSAAVAAAILEYRCRRGIDIFAGDGYYPNKHVFRKTLKALRQKTAE